MPIELWGATEASLPIFPRHPLGYLALLFFIATTLLWFRYSPKVTSKESNQQPYLFPLSLIGAFIFSQLFVWELSIGTYWLQTGLIAEQGLTLALFSAVFLLLAPLLLNSAQLLLVALAAGLGMIIGQTGQILSIFQPIFFVIIVAGCLQQGYQGTLYRWLRVPIVAAIVAAISLLPLLLITAVSQHAQLGGMAALDIGLASMLGDGLAWFVAAAVGGAIVTLLQQALPILQPDVQLTAVPLSTRLTQRLQSDILLIGGIVLLVITVTSFSKMVADAQALVLSQMGLNAEAALSQLPQFQAEAQLVLTQVAEDGRLTDGNQSTTSDLLIQSAETLIFDAVVLLDTNGDIIEAGLDEDIPSTIVQESYPSYEQTESTQQGVAFKQLSGSTSDILLVSLPVANAQTLLGHVSPSALTLLVAPLDDLFESGNGFIFDDANQLIVDTRESSMGETTWHSDSVLGKRPISLSELDGTAYIGRLFNSPNRHLVYQTNPRPEGWEVVATVPFTVVLDEAIRNSLWLSLLLLSGLGLLYVRLNRWGNSVTQPISELASISQRVAAGEKIAPTIHQQRQDEIGQLSQAFSQMQSTIDRRLTELNLLLDVSSAVSSSMVIQQGLPKVLDGVLLGTEAIGVRIILRNQHGNRPLTFAAGDASESMQTLDRQIMKRGQNQSILILENPATIREGLQLESRQDLPVAALSAFSIQALNRYQGVLWLGYGAPHQVDEAEHKLIKTLARQTAVLVENAILFARAEGGRRQLKAILSSTSNAVIVTDPTGRISMINPAFAQAFGVTEADIKDRPIAKVVPNQALVDKLASDDATWSGVEITTQSGRTFFANTSAITTGEGQTMGRVAVLQDITSYKEADELKSEFVATVSHDLRSPLTFMRGFATMLPMVGDLNDRQSEYVFKIMNGIDQMSALVEDLLDLRRIDEISRMEERVDMAALMHLVAGDYRHLASERGLQLRVQVVGSLPSIIGDEKSLRSVFINLIENGIKYAPNSGELLLHGEKGDKELLLMVKDNGPGIPKKDLALIFEQFYRAKQQGEERIKGSGLGLALVKKIIQRHGGRIWCESEVGEGATFFIALPLPKK